MFQTISHQSRVDHLQVEHIIQVNGFCPVTKNPQQGSTLHIKYTPKNCVLDATTIKTHIDSFKGGKMVDGLHIRNMETLVEQIAIDAVAVLGVLVTVQANGYLKGGQTVQLSITHTPTLTQLLNHG